MNELKAILVLCLSSFLFISACQGSLSEDVTSTDQHKVSPDKQLFLPTHGETLGTDYGHDFMYGTLLVVDDCLRLASPQDNGEPGPYPLLPVWPVGFTVSIIEGLPTVLDETRAVKARAGDAVRFGGFTAWSSDTRKESFLQNLPEQCHGGHWLVGDEVTIVAQDEPTVVELEGSTLHFPREKTETQKGRTYRAALGRRTLTLDGGCLRLGEDGPTIIWPPGFTPNIVDSTVGVRNGGGQTMAKVGEIIEIGGGVTNGGTGPCGAKIWVDTKILD